MRTTAIARVAAPAALAAVLAAAWPVIDQAAAATSIAPDFANSSVAVGGSPMSLAQAEVHPIKTISLATVAFTEALQQSGWTDQTNPTAPVSHSSTLCVESTGSAPKCVTDPTTTSFPAANTMQISVPATLPDGVYRLHASYWSSSCHNVVPVVQPQDANCTGSDGADIVDPSTNQPFQFTVDDTPPAAPAVSAPAAIDANSVHGVAISGTAEPGSNVFVTVTSGGGGSTFFANPSGTTAGPDGSWSITPSLVSLPDGTLTVNATASDAAGNVSAAGSPSTAPVLAARPSSPRNLTTVGGDSAIGLLWNAPTSTGGHPLTGYAITYTDTTTGGAAQTVTAAASATTALLSNLVNGHAYAVTIAATNDIGAGAPAAATVTPRSRSGLYVTPSYKAVTYGKTITLLGRLTTSSTSDTGIGNVPVTVTTKYDNGAPGPTLHATTDDFGYWQITGVRPTKDTNYTAVYAGDAANGASFSTAQRVLVRTVVHISKASASRISGTVSPNERGRRVYLYEIRGHHTVRLGTATLTSRSTWVFRHTWRRGTHYVIAKFLTQNGIQGNTSNRVKIVR